MLSSSSSTLKFLIKKFRFPNRRYSIHKMLDAFKSIDSFPKALDDFRIKTTSGAIGLYFFPTSCIYFMAFIVSCIFISLNPVRALYGFLVLLRDEILLQNSKFKVFAYITCSI